MSAKVWTQEQDDRAADEWQNRVFSVIDEDVDDGIRPEALAGCQQAGENLCRENTEASELLSSYMQDGRIDAVRATEWLKRNTEAGQ